MHVPAEVSAPSILQAFARFHPTGARAYVLARIGSAAGLSRAEAPRKKDMSCFASRPMQYCCSLLLLLLPPLLLLVLLLPSLRLPLLPAIVAAVAVAAAGAAMVVIVVAVFAAPADAAVAAM